MPRAGRSVSRFHRTARAIALAAAGAVGTAGCATTMPPLDPSDAGETAAFLSRAGSRPVRIGRTDGAALPARNIRIAASAVSWADDRGAGVIPIAEVASLRVRKSGLAAGAAGGGFVGFLAGVAAGSAWFFSGSTDFDRDAAIPVLALTGAAGGVIGGAFGMAGAMTWLEFPVLLPETRDPP